jgi:putative hydrolase of the HAD superfamily
MSDFPGAVTFDFWNTLVRPVTHAGAHRAERWVELLAADGHTVGLDVVTGVFDAEWQAHHQAWLANEQYTGERGARSALASLGLDVPSEREAELIEAFGGIVGLEYALCPGVESVLAELARRGLPIGIICDVGFTPSTTLRAMLADFGVLGYFAGWSFSDEVGTYKPAVEIFEHALGYLDRPASVCVHIGDLRRTDVAGAHAAGFTSIRYHGVHDDPDEGPRAHHDLADYGMFGDLFGW